MRGSDSFNLCPRKKQGENLSSLSLVSELLEKNKESRRIRSVFLASLTRKWIPGTEEKIWHFYKLFSPLKFSFVSKATHFARPWRQHCWQCTSRTNLLWLMEIQQNTGTQLEETSRHQRSHCPAPRQSQSSLPWCLSDLFEYSSSDGDSTLSSLNLLKVLTIFSHTKILLDIQSTIFLLHL